MFEENELVCDNPFPTEEEIITKLLRDAGLSESDIIEAFTHSYQEEFDYGRN